MLSDKTHLAATDCRMTTIMGGKRRVIRFDPFGRPPEIFVRRLGIAGQPWECQPRLYPLGKRFYSPTLMRFLQPDSWSPFGAGGNNTYAYAACDPVNYSDPTGHLPFSGILKAISGNVFLMDDVIVAGKKVLIIDAHGNAGIGQLGKQILNGKEFADVISSNVKFTEYDHVNLVMCFSANTPVDGGMPFAQAFAEQARIKTIGYRGTVTANYNSKELAKHFTAGKPIDRYKVNTKNPFGKKHSEFNTFSYDPVEFLPMELPNVRKGKKRR